MKGKLKNRLSYFLFLLIIIPLTIELSPYVLSPVIYKQSFSRKNIQSELLGQYNREAKKVVGSSKKNAENEYLGDHILHPYLGFVNVPNKNYNRFCFPGSDPITTKASGKINICLMGGSVALGLYNTSKDELIEKLKASKYFKDKEISISLFALGGFKQPQQLMALNYFLSLGAEYDIVINLDGFNEIVLPFSDNLPSHVFPSYPRHWSIYSRKSLNSKVQFLLAKQLILKDEQIRSDQFFVKSYLYKSNFGLLFWNALNNDKRTSLFQIEAQLKKAISQSDSDYQSTGPVEAVKDTTAFFAEQAALWQRSSTIIGGIGKTAGFDYFHFLQPNQYFQNTKVLTEEELTIAYEHQPFAYKTAVQTGYPFLIKQGQQLLNNGINFFDLTLIFKNEKRTVYNDKCCHFNELGYNLIADKIARSIVNHFEKTKSVNTEK
jgi:hypothetical protein